MNTIPIRNLWLLMLYAAELSPLLEQDDSSIENNPEIIPDLVTELFLHLLEQRLRRPLGLAYQAQSRIETRVRGRIDTLKTASQQLLLRGQVACHYQELTVDNPLNAYWLAALETASRLVSQAALRQRCQYEAQLLRRLGVSAEKPEETTIRALHFAVHQKTDQQLTEIAHLLFSFMIPNEETGKQSLVRPERDLSKIRYLYEKAVAGFYRTKLTPQGWKVSTQARLNWPISQKSAGITAILPQMQSDIMLEHRAQQQRWIIDTKFTQILKANQWRETLSEKHIYQIYAYLKSQTGQPDPLADHANAMLLYPSYGKIRDEYIELQGHWIRFVTVDLMASAKEITEQLLAVLQTPEPHP
ncbi:5-methylcytosine restriction system specificity protein McrC [Thiolinea disciformis]|uniref:5-methylcytosine restriction system specificity protein McrC n=1 Tax=Thiolinea disciformis TaxID=125614 RepID=UPI00037776A0|nr:hypothetical protein [Thiolinea disciformis]